MSIDRNNLPAGLLIDVKNYLNITWDDDATDQKISGIVAAGIYYINSKAGKENDYTKDGMPRTILFEFARYMRDDALDVFENNYRSLLLAMQNEGRVTAYVERAEQT